MLRVLLVFMAIGGVYCQINCKPFSAFSTYPNRNGLQRELIGTFLVVYTSATVVNCQRINYVTKSNNFLTGQVESPGCCVKINNFAFNSNELEYNIGPISGYTASCPSLITQNGAMKLLATTGAGSSLCLIVAICQQDYYGINVMCRGAAPLLIDITAILLNLLGFLQFHTISALQSVNQTGCVFQTNNCPTF